MNVTDPASRRAKLVADVSTAHPRLRAARLLLQIVVIAIAASVVWWLITNPRFEWPVVGEYLFAEPILRGIQTTLFLTAACFILGGIGGIIVVAMRTSPFALLRIIADAYLWVVRSVPMLVQLIFWYNFAYLVPRIVVGIPFGPEFFSWDSNAIITSLMAGIIGLSIHDSAYMAEIFRSGLTSVDSGQKDAARALGYRGTQIFFSISMPQAVRVIIPPATSQLISLMKATSLVSVIGMTDLLHAAQIIYSQNYEIVPLLLVATIWYLVLVGALTLVQRWLERRMGNAYDRSAVSRKKSPRSEKVAA